MKQQTTVEWLYNLSKQRELDKFDLEQAKQMETEQMKEVYIQACFDSITYEITNKIKAEQYYNKTFNK
jgi:hypothetical protein